MKLESIKSFTLTFLIVVSILLTAGLWSYQSDDEVLNDSFATSISVGGEGNLKKSDLIGPSEITFQVDDKHYGFAKPNQSALLFDDMHTWGLTGIQSVDRKDQITNKRQMEITFPTALPLSFLPSLFNVVESGRLPNWSFDRIVITFIENRSELKFHFISEDEQQRLTAVVKETSKYERLWNYTTKENTDLIELLHYDKGAEPIYIPQNNVTLEKTQHTVDRIDETKLVDILFPNTLASGTGNYYNDSEKDLRISADNLSMELLNSKRDDSENVQIPAGALLDYSRQNINDYKGWTDTYKLVEINSVRRTLRYRMIYEGLPTFSTANLSVIEQEFGENGELYHYSRPIISLKSVLPDSTSVELRSGMEVISYLEREYDDSELEAIQNIKIGYDYSYNEELTLATLNPAWFMRKQDDSEWEKISFEPKKGGAVDAMESN
ncbi:YycH family regulatory protein [Virgibacillus flavescens]|uniref:YycH family regulatory protein n=1 Tax=Virgibacillus flavescens TaxID=1611422 RepID=UPI003D3522C4